MKNQRGITLISLITYVIIMSIVLIVITSIVHQFYQNTDSIEADTEEILQMGKLNTYFLKEVKYTNNKIDTIGENYIIFKTGNSFSFTNNKIYYNQIEICNHVKDFTLSQDENENVINVTANFENFTKTISYKIEEIY